ncbi:MAG: glycosyltransferase family 2 protein [Phycisphaeraceae bacterium]
MIDFDFFIMVLLWILALSVSMPLWVLVVECVIGLIPASLTGNRKDSTVPPSLAVLIPAHNEERVIGTTLNSLLSALPDVGRIVVVADNCTDQTAEVARSYGVDVIERHDTINRGKGFALAAGLDHLSHSPPEVVIIVDADCTVSDNALTDLAVAAHNTNRPTQGIYLMSPPKTDDAKGVVSAFAFMVKNLARPRGLAMLGLPVPLTGSGMAFPYPQLSTMNLATGNIVEDLALGLACVERGYGPVLCDSVRIHATLPSYDTDAAATQRTRWEHGYLSTLFSVTPKLLIRGLTGFKPALIAAAIDLAVPPLSLLVLLACCVWLFLVTIGLMAGSLAPAWFLGLTLVIAGSVLLLCWARYGRGYLPLRSFLSIPGYILWKLPIYARFLVRRESSWIRTERNTSHADTTGQSNTRPHDGASY